MFKKFLVIVIVIVAIIIIVNLVRQTYSALGSDKRLNQLIDDVAKVENENKQLKKELTEADSLNSVEEVARDNLNMALPNETIVVVPDDLINEVLNPPPKPVEIEVPNWQGWLNLFIH